MLKAMLILYSLCKLGINKSHPILTVQTAPSLRKLFYSPFDVGKYF
jgi:hypothetical protein